MGPNDNYRFTCLLPRTLDVGDQIILKGKMQSDPEYFSLNLVKDPKNVALQYKINYKTKQTGLNTLTDGVWGNELKYAQVAVQPGATFTVKFAIELERLVVSFDDNKFGLEYFYRTIPMNEIKELQFWFGLNEIISTEVIYGKKNSA